MFTDFSRVLSKYSIPLTVYDIETEGFDDAGEAYTNYSSGTVERMMPIPFKTENLKYLPEGAYTTDDYKFIQVGSGIHKTKAVILYNNKQYRIKDIFDRYVEGNFIEYLTKRIDLNDSII